MSDRRTTPSRDGAPTTVRLRPTLFVALGGTGKEIVLRLRRRILQNDWGGGHGESLRVSDIGNFPIASFIYFDTDTTDAIETNRSRRADPLSRAVAFKDSGEAAEARGRAALHERDRQLPAYPGTGCPRATWRASTRKKAPGRSAPYHDCCSSSSSNASNTWSATRARPCSTTSGGKATCPS